MDEKELVKWGNARVKKDFHVSRLSSKKIKKCLWLLHLLETVEKKRYVNWDLILEGNIIKIIFNNFSYFSYNKQFHNLYRFLHIFH